MAAFKSKIQELESASDYLETVVCQPCLVLKKSSSAKMFCVDCQEYLCTNCTTNHKTFKQLRSHALVSLDESLKNPKVKKDKCSKKCSVHKDKSVKYFCGTHSVLGCSRCAIGEHKLCADVMFIPSIAENLKSNSEFKRFTENLTSLDTAAEMLTAAIENTLIQLKLEPKEIQEAIQRTKDDVIAKLDELEKKITTQAESVKKEQIDKLQELSKTFETTRIRVDQLKYETDSFIKEGQNCEAFVLMKANTLKLQTFKIKIEEACKVRVKHAIFRSKELKNVSFGDLDVHEAPVGQNIKLPGDITQQFAQFILGKGTGQKDIKQEKDLVKTHGGKKLNGPSTARILRVGSRVRVTKEFRTTVKDLYSRGGAGTVSSMPRDLRKGKVTVTWDETGNTEDYCMGLNGLYRLELIE